MNTKSPPDWDAKLYRTNGKFQERAATNFIEKLSFMGDESVLDLGCGTGNVTKVLAEKAYSGKVLGIDQSPLMIEEARKEFGNISNLNFDQKNIENLAFENEFDLITSFFTLHWVKDQKKAIQNIKKALKPGGKIHFLITSGGGAKLSVFLKQEDWGSNILDPKDRFPVVTDDQYSKLLQTHGFIIEDLKVVNISHIFPTRFEAIQSVMSWAPFATGLSFEESYIFAFKIINTLCKDPNKETDVEIINPVLQVQAHL